MQSIKPSKAPPISDTATAACCFRLGAITFAGVIFASLVDIADFAITLAFFLSVSGILRGTAASIAGDEFLARVLNRWDESVTLIFLSVIVYWAAL